MHDMADDPQTVLAVFAEAVRALLQDKELRYANPAERAIVGRLANMIAGKFDGWSIDIEWNRREDVIKKLPYDLSDEELKEQGAIVPDLIVHRVGKRENLLVVEVKKVSNRDFAGDIWKLQGMTDTGGNYGYAAGLHLVVDMAAGRVPQCDVYIDGSLQEDLTDWMRGQLP